MAWGASMDNASSAEMPWTGWDCGSVKWGVGWLRLTAPMLRMRRKQAVASAEAALTEAWQAEVIRATAEAEERVVSLEADLARVRLQMEEQARSGESVVSYHYSRSEGTQR